MFLILFRLRLFWLKMKFGNHFLENKAFGWHGKFGQTENIFSLIENSAKNDWNHFQSLFSEKPFPPLSHTHCLSQSFTASTHTPSQTERSTPTHHDRDLAGHRNCADRRRSRSRSRSRRSASIAIIGIGEIARSRSRRDLWSFLGFIWVFRNEWHYVFVW